MREHSLPGGYVAREVDRFEEESYRALLQRVFHDEFPELRLDQCGDETKRRRLKEELGRPNALRIGIYLEEQLVGWTFGWQDGETSFYMASSGVLHEHRRRGLYRFLVERVLEFARDKGFHTVRSRHIATNNPVLIAKLKLGFVVSAMELSDSLGILVHLTHHLHPLRRHATDYRAGLTRPNPELRALLGL